MTGSISNNPGARTEWRGRQSSWQRLAEDIVHNRWLMRGTDGFVLMLTAPLGLLLRLATVDPAVFTPPAVSSYMAASLVVSLILWFAMGLHKASWVHASWRDLGLILVVAVVTPVLASLTGFLVDRLVSLPRSLPLFHALALFVGLCGVRVLARQLNNLASPKQAVNAFARADLLLVGRVDLAAIYLEASRALGGKLVSVAGLLSDDPVASETLINSIPVLGKVDQLPAVLAQLRYHGVYVRQIVLLQSRTQLPPEFWTLLDREGIELSDFHLALVGHAGS